MTTEAELKRAATRIVDCEIDLKRYLNQGEQRDLLKDNFDDWSSDKCDNVVASLNVGHGVGAFHLAEQRRRITR